MKKTDAFAIGAFVLLVLAVIAVIVAFVTDSFNVLYVAAALALFAIVLIAVLIYVFGGIYFLCRKKTQAYEGSSMTLDDVHEVDREMEKK